MKKTLLLTFFLLPLLCFSQPSDNNYMYAEIVGTSRLLSNKVTVQIDFGQETKLFSENKNRIIDEETGKPRIFNSMVDAMNYMGTLGWEFVHGYSAA